MEKTPHLMVDSILYSTTTTYEKFRFFCLYFLGTIIQIACVVTVFYVIKVMTPVDMSVTLEKVGRTTITSVKQEEKMSESDILLDENLDENDDDEIDIQEKAPKFDAAIAYNTRWIPTWYHIILTILLSTMVTFISFGKRRVSLDIQDTGKTSLRSLFFPFFTKKQIIAGSLWAGLLGIYWLATVLCTLLCPKSSSFTLMQTANLGSLLWSTFLFVLMLRISFFHFFVLDQNMSIGQALKKSWQLTGQWAWAYFTHYYFPYPLIMMPAVFIRNFGRAFIYRSNFPHA